MFIKSSYVRLISFVSECFNGYDERKYINKHLFSKFFATFLTIRAINSLFLYWPHPEKNVVLFYRKQCENGNMEQHLRKRNMDDDVTTPLRGKTRHNRVSDKSRVSKEGK